MPDENPSMRLVTLRLPELLYRFCQEQAVHERRSLNFILVEVVHAWMTTAVERQQSLQSRTRSHPPYNTKTQQLGQLCVLQPQAHQYGDTGMSLRLKKTGECCACALAVKKQHRQRVTLQDRQEPLGV